MYSILIPTHHNIEYLKPCVESILNNSHFKTHQLCIHLDEYHKDTLDYLNELVKTNIIKTYTYTKDHRGMAYAFNRCFEQAMHDKVLLANDDCYFTKNWDLNLHQWEIEMDELFPDYVKFIGYRWCEPTHGNSYPPICEAGTCIEEFKPSIVEKYVNEQSRHRIGKWSLPMSIFPKTYFPEWSEDFYPKNCADADWIMKLHSKLKQDKVKFLMFTAKDSYIYHFQRKATRYIKDDQNAHIKFQDKWKMEVGTACKMFEDETCKSIEFIKNSQFQKYDNNNNSNIEIIGITTCGTYPSWIDYTIASFYNHVDKIIVVNGGYDIYHPEKGAINPLEREHKLIQSIDINNKITEVVPTEDDINRIFQTTCREGQDEFGRSSNMTLATQLAYDSKSNSKKSWILKLDSDQVLYKITRQYLETIINYHSNKTGFRFAQYADYYHDFNHISGLPDEFTNDGSLLYKSLPNQGYRGQGSPGYIHVDQYPIYSIKTSHMRRISPPNVEPYEYHFRRLWYHTYGPNSVMGLEYNRKTNTKFTDEQTFEIAHKETVSKLREKGNDIKKLSYDIRVPYEPPLACQMTPLEYIKKGY